MKKKTKGKFNIGDRVEILDSYKYKIEDDGIPGNLMIHGGHTPNQKAPNACIVDIYENFYIVNYLNEYGAQMQLGFEEDCLKLLERAPDKEEEELEQLFEYSEPDTPEFDENCIEGCTPGEHICGK